MSKQNLISASQVRELYRQMGRTPTEKQIKQMLSAVNNK
ncbi:YneF family protein [Streptococcus pneumoniae]